MPSKKTSRKPAAKKTVKKKELSEASRLRRNRMWSSAIFVLGVFLIFLTYIKGEFLWEKAHNVLWGLMGVSAVLFAPITIYVAVMLALDRSKSAVVTKVIQGGVLMLLISPAFEIIYCMMNRLPVYDGKNVSAVLNALYVNGKELKGGGAMSIIIGGTLSKLCGATGALIIIILLTLLFAMLLTNITLVDVFRFFSGIWHSASDAIREDGEERAEIEARRLIESQRAEKEQKDSKKDKRIDVAKFIPDDKPVEPEKPAIADKTTTIPEPVTIPDLAVDKEKDASKKDTPRFLDLSNKRAKRKKTDIVEQPDGTDTNIISGEDSGIVNPIYIDEDGQASFIESEENEKPSYSFPSIELLNLPNKQYTIEDSQMEIQKNSETLVETLRSFGVATRIIDVHRGPSVTRYELQPAAGVKVSKITTLANDIALNLAANGVRIEAPIPGKAAVGIELANKTRETVCIRELIDSEEFRSQKSKLGFPVGKNIEGDIVLGDIAKMPHLLIAGTTGSGKSVFTNSIIMSILYNATPDEVKLILIDPKQVEFPIYNGIPHLLIPVVTEARKAAGALGWAVTEMMKRYKLFSDNSVREFSEYNEFVKGKEGMTPLPKIVIVVDELADLMMAAKKEVEESICRIAQLARAAGMHLVIATQSPRTDIVTGLIKANIPSRVALKVSNMVDSRVILDEGGAETLLGNGDLLYMPVGIGKPIRIQGSYVATEEIRRVVDFLKAQTSAQYDDKVSDEIEKLIPVPKGEKPASSGGGSDDAPSDNGQDELVERAIEAIIREGVASTTFLQRRLKLGYARAARVMEEIEQMGIIGPANGAKPREILMSKEQWLERRVAMGAPVPELPMSDIEE